jgi:hypothetical protein
MILIESKVSATSSEFLRQQDKVKNKSRWISKDRKFYYEWDSLHGEIEVYDRNGYHVQVLNPDGSLNLNKPAIRGRKIDV